METDAITRNFDSLSAYSYLLEWEWPEHIENVLRRLLFIGLSEAAGDRSQSERDQSCTDNEVDSLAARLAWLICVSPESNPAVLHALAQQEPAIYPERIAENPRALAETLRQLAAHPSSVVRSAVAENINTEEDVLLALVNDESVDVRYSMAENANLPESVLQILSDDSNSYVAARASKTLSRLAPRANNTTVFPLHRTQDAKQGLRRAVQ
jgi:hypothetical protein